jgi:hypothetical protein
MLVQSAISALRRLREEDHKLQGSLGYIVRLCPKKKEEDGVEGWGGGGGGGGE